MDCALSQTPQDNICQVKNDIMDEKWNFQSFVPAFFIAFMLISSVIHSLFYYLCYFHICVQNVNNMWIRIFMKRYKYISFSWVANSFTTIYIVFPRVFLMYNFTMEKIKYTLYIKHKHNLRETNNYKIVCFFLKMTYIFEVLLRFLAFSPSNLPNLKFNLRLSYIYMFIIPISLSTSRSVNKYIYHEIYKFVVLINNDIGIYNRQRTF